MNWGGTGGHNSAHNNFSTDGAVGMFQVVMVSDGERQMKLRWPMLSSCCAAGFLTGHRLVLVSGLGFGDPWSRRFTCLSVISVLSGS